jgi:hypothetical protein
LLSVPYPFGDYVSSDNTTPQVHALDLKLQRSFGVAGARVRVYFYAQNLINRKNVQQVYPHTGTAAADGSHTPNVRAVISNSYGEDFFTLYDHVNFAHGQNYQIRYGSDRFMHPREIRLGVELGW